MMTGALLGQAVTERDASNMDVYARQASSSWRGYPMDKCAQDVLVYQEIIMALRPDIIIETGTWYGGSGLFFADMCELVGAGRVLSIDKGTEPYPLTQRLAQLPQHPRLTYLTGDSADPATVAKAHAWADGATGLVVLDSDHSASHVLAELEEYHDLVSVGGFLIVEDTNVNGHPVRGDFGLGPWEAVQAWLGVADHPAFVPDADVEPYITFAPGGYLRRLR